MPGAYIITGQPEKETILFFYLFFALLLYVLRFLREKKKIRWIATASVSILLLMFIYWEKKPEELRISMIDVDQGDCILIQTEKGTTILIDGGSSSVTKVARYRIVPFLKAIGVRKIDYVLLSHSDSDHMNGIQEMLEENLFSIENIGISENPDFLENYEELRKLAEKKDVNFFTVTAGDKLINGKLEMEILSPDNGFYSDVNSASMMLFVRQDEFSMCFTGDTDAENEKKILTKLKDCDILKVAHHGSNTSSTMEFLKQINPQAALISCGVDNRYGHPHEETLEHLKQINAKTFITAEAGCIQIEVKNQGMKYQITRFIKGKQREM
jgi:competence protein ComEC